MWYASWRTFYIGHFHNRQYTTLLHAFKSFVLLQHDFLQLNLLTRHVFVGTFLTSSYLASLGVGQVTFIDKKKNKYIKNGIYRALEPLEERLTLYWLFSTVINLECDDDMHNGVSCAGYAIASINQKWERFTRSKIFSLKRPHEYIDDNVFDIAKVLLVW